MERNEYDQILQAEFGQGKQQLRQTMYGAVAANPDQAAEAVKLSRTTGLPADVVERNVDRVRRDVLLNEYDGLLTDSPALARRFTEDPAFAKIGHDDLGPLKAIEHAVRSFMQRPDDAPAQVRPTAQILRSAEFSSLVREIKAKNPALSFDEARQLAAQGTTVDDQAQLVGNVSQPTPTLGNMLRGATNLEYFRGVRANMRGATADALGHDPTQHQREARTAFARVANTDPRFETATGQAVYSGLVSTVRNAPGVALSMLTGNPAPALAFAGAMSGLDQYGQVRERGGTPGEAAAAGALTGGIEVATELIPMRFLVDKLGRAGFTQVITGLLAREIPGEQLATLAQDAVDTAIANPDKTWAQYLEERPGAAYQTLVSTVVQAPAVGASALILRSALR